MGTGQSNPENAGKRAASVLFMQTKDRLCGPLTSGTMGSQSGRHFFIQSHHSGPPQVSAAGQGRACASHLHLQDRMPLHLPTQISWGRCLVGNGRGAQGQELAKAHGLPGTPNLKARGWEPSPSLGWKVGASVTHQLALAGLCLQRSNYMGTNRLQASSRCCCESYARAHFI